MGRTRIRARISTVSGREQVLNQPIVIAALYKFVRLDDYKARREALLEFCRSHHLKGTLLLAREGINGTVSGTRAAIDALLNHLRADPCFEGLEHKESYEESQPFYRMKVKLKKEIVTMVSITMSDEGLTIMPTFAPLPPPP